MKNHKRRAEDSMDPLQDQIDALILEADSPKDKAFLMIMNKIALSLDANTGLTRTLGEDLKKHTEAFTAHEVKELEMINQGKGFWRATLASIVIMQSAAVWWFQGHISETKETQQEVATLKQEMNTHKEHHRLEEATKGGPRL